MREISSKSKLDELILELMTISDQQWCDYQFKREILVGKLSLSEQRAWGELARQCGERLAEVIYRKYRTKNIHALCRTLNVAISYGETAWRDDRLTLATYDETTGICLMTEPIQKFEQEKITALPLEQVASLILAHELYHHLETCDPTLYTQQKTVELWRFFGYRHQSKIRTLSEIAAMSFSEKLNNVGFSPYVLEVAMIWPYDPLFCERLVQSL
ncbi:hypothetical protein QJ527_05475 [Enterococcus mundtii]|uniref:hypothetical protein n=1 Tax=Enterococcus TaxID=1350 RepID=UPI00044FA244|nr:hypothetical protein [Enterococcus mundtii]EYT95445.1 hypothetical protein AK89_08050 [Enterococcus mundtii CRL35]MDK4210994.1 hypothetical protein [Enterococcus mundtii]MDO7879420.1 hypothetical protein [Enterococcus mundtii]